MVLFSDERCLGYHTLGHPEQPARVERSRQLLEKRHKEWEWRAFEAAPESVLRRAHSLGHLERLHAPVDFDADTAYHEGIYELARLSAGAALAAMATALAGEKAFSLMRPPGHHAEWDRAMGFCYLNNVAICALRALDQGTKRVAIWDFDAHHGNGTEAILRGVEGALYVSIHQHPCFPGTGVVSTENCRNYPVPPMTPPSEHMDRLRESWDELMAFQPELVLVSAGFDAYELDPITQMTLRMKDFETLGSWLGESPVPVAAALEGGYSDELPELLDGFLSAWAK